MESSGSDEDENNVSVVQSHGSEHSEHNPTLTGTNIDHPKPSKKGIVLRRTYNCKLCGSTFSTVANYKSHLAAKKSCIPQSDLQIFKKLIDEFVEALRQFDSTESNNDKTSMIKLGRQMARLYKVLTDEEKEEIYDDYHEGVLAVLDEFTS